MESMKATMESLQKQLATMSSLRPKLEASPPGKTTPVHGMAEVEMKLLNLFPINQMTPSMMHILKSYKVGEFIRLQLVQKLYGTHPDTKPDAEKVVEVFLDFMLSKRFQVIV